MHLKSKLLLDICLLLSSQNASAFSPSPNSISQVKSSLTTGKTTTIEGRKHFNVSDIQSLSRGGSSSQLNAWPLTAADSVDASPDYNLAFKRVGITVAATYFTWLVQNQYSSVMASAAFSIVCALTVDKRICMGAFCGSFAGMCSKAVVSSPALALALGGLTSFFFEAMIHYKNAFAGLGGRLGFTAFLATSIVTALSGVSTNFSVGDMKLSALNWSLNGPIVQMAFWHAVGSVATIFLRETSDDERSKDPVRASAIVGLAGALFLKDKTAALAVYGGSFVGMAAPARLMYGLGNSLKEKDGKIKVWSAFAVAAALGGVVHGATMDWNFWAGGWGGKAGTCAFIGCILFRILATIYAKILG